MKKNKDDSLPRQIRCFKAVEAYVGGRVKLAKILGVSPKTIAIWVVNRSIPSKHLIRLADLCENRFTERDFLG